MSRIALKATDIEVLGPEESLGTFDAVIATVPAPQMAPWSALIFELTFDLSMIVISPALWSRPLGHEGAAPPEAELSRCLGGGTVAQQHGAPGLSTWTIEAPPQWSGDHLEMSKDELSQLFIRACEEAGEAPPLEAGRIGGVMLGLSGLWEHLFVEKTHRPFGLAMEPSVEALRGLVPGSVPRRPCLRVSEMVCPKRGDPLLSS